MSTWLREIVAVMERLGGHAKYRDLYLEFQSSSSIDITTVKDFKAQIRGTIEAHSSDSDVFKGKSKDKDIFYSVEGKGKGHWGLRDFEINSINVDLTFDETGFSEGRKILKQHIFRERDYRVIVEAKKRFKALNGYFFCEACGFSFKDSYGAIGEDFIEGHHLKPVAKLLEDEKTQIEDIVLLCSNCHSMVHRYRPWINSKKDLKKLLLKNS